MANTTYKISRICSSFNYGRWNIHKFGYTPKGEFVKVKSDFTDYFYFNSEEVSNLIPFNKLDQNDYGDYMSVYGKPTRKIEYRSIKEKNQVVSQYPESVYEADVPPEFKYLMEIKHEWADSSERHILYFDIETWAKDISSTPERPDAPITSIQLYSTRFQRYFLFAWHPEKTSDFSVPKILQNEEVTYIFSKDERGVIESFIAFFEEYSPDIISGWWSAGFDLPYILNRCSRLNIDYNRLSPIGKVNHYQKKGNWKTYISGVDHIDMLEAIKDIGYNLPNYKLATAAKEILQDPDIEKLTEVTWADWMDNFGGFIKYGLRDVEILKEIDEELKIFDLYCTIQKLTNITTLGEVMFKSSVVDKFILTESHGEYVFPTRSTSSRQKYMGAHVMDPKPGLHKDVAIFDFASLYPTSIMTFNISPETFICSDKQLERRGLTIDDVIENLNKRNIPFIDTGYDTELFGNRYLFYSHSHRLGIFPKILKKMYEERKAIKSEMRNESDEHKLNTLDKHQQAIKLILNSAYGALGFNYFRLYKPECADSITYFARQALYFAQESLQKEGMEVIYQDTDSEFALQNGKTATEINMWVDRFNGSEVIEFAQQYNNGEIESFEDYLTLEMEYEKDLERIYFGYDDKLKIGVKKRYYGIIRNSRKKYIRGLNIIRKDTPEFLKKKLDVLSELAVNDALQIKHLETIKKLIKLQDLKNIGITKAFGKRFDAYDKTQPQHLVAAKWANEILGCNINHTHNPYLFYVISKCEDHLPKGKRNKAICLLEEDLEKAKTNPDLFEIDYDIYFRKQVLDQLEEFDLIPSVKNVIAEYKEKMK